MRIGGLRRGNRSRRGQSILIAVAVLFILSFLGALFITIVAETIQHTQLHTNTQNFDVFAKAGIEFADKMLTTSPQGADWRPPLTNVISQQPSNTPPTGGNPFTGCMLQSIQQCDAYAAVASGLSTGADPPTANPNAVNADPDRYYLDRGFTRYNIPGGRFLLRLSYEDYPLSQSPSGFSKYIKIESVGLVGNITADDPTTYVNAGTNTPNRRAVEVAYKPIAITDYGTFITNKNHLPGPAELGVDTIINTNTADATFGEPATPGVHDFVSAWNSTTAPAISAYPIMVQYGNPNAYNDPTNGSGGGGSIRSNANLRLHGLVSAFLDPTYNEQWEIAGTLTFDGYNPTNTSGVPIPLNAQPTQLLNMTVSTGTSPAVSSTNVAPSNGGANAPFDSLGGEYRDGSGLNDDKGLPRSIQYLTAPSLDVIDPNSGLTRYAELAQTGVDGTGLQPDDGSSPQPQQAGPYKPGAPATVIIDNATDMQQESGGATMREEWLNPQPSTISSNWKGDFYVPPAATIVFGAVPGITNPDPAGGTAPIPVWGFTVTRSDHGLSGTPTWTWHTPSGKVMSTEATRMRFVYASEGSIINPPTFDPTDPIYYLDADNRTSPFGTAPAGANPYTANTIDPNNDIVIYAEGNVRVRGTISDPSGDPNPASGSAQKPGNGFFSDHHVTLVTNGIAYIDGSILKGNYLQDAPAGGTPALGPPPPPGGTGPQGTGATQSYSNSSIAILASSYVAINTTQFFAGPEDYSSYYASPNTPVSGNTAIGSAYDIGAGQSLTEAFTLPEFYLNGSGASVERLFLSSEGDGGDAYGLISAAFDGATPQPIYQNVPSQSGIENNRVIGLTTAPFNVDQSMQEGLITFQIDQTQSAKDWLLHRAAILPADIRVEANLFSENNAFFVIPGPWFNDNPNDSIDRAAERASAATDPDFPLYGQPVDMQITVYGSVTENMPADIGDQSAWMLKWGWIPKYYGTSTDATVHQKTQGVGIGLNFVYDSMEGYPYHQFHNGQVMFGRVDAFGRALPFAPDLPVSPDLIYSGQESEQNYQ